MSTLPLFDRPALGDVTPTTLRDYQQRAIGTLRAHVIAGRLRILLVAPTGAGKMVVIASIIRTSTLPVLFVCHRMELIDQCAEQLARMGITNIGVIRGDDDRLNPSATIQIASIQTLARRDKPFAGKKCLVIIDEAHRAASESYREHVFAAYPEQIILGFTASPLGAGNKPLGSDGLFQQLEVTTTYAHLIKHRFIAVPDCYSTPLQPDLSNVHTSAGDFVEEELGEIMGRRELVGGVVNHWLALAHKHPKYTSNGARLPELVDGPRRPTFCFAVNIAHSESLCASFEHAGVRVAHLDGKTKENVRRAMLRDLAGGQLEIICNCNVLLEGVDVPEAKCVVHARPTLSLVLWMQSTGRIMRPWCPICRKRCELPGHRSVVPLLLDHAGNHDRHLAPHVDRSWSLTTAPVAKGVTPMKLCKSCFAYCEAGRLACAYCGAVFPPPERAMPTPQETEAKLALRQGTPEATQRAFWEKHFNIARSRGHKPGYVAWKFHEEYGAWPPNAWGDEVKSTFAADTDWQRRLKEKEERKAAEEGRAPIPERVQAPPAEEAFPDVESFAAWLETQGIQKQGESDPWGLNQGVPADQPTGDCIMDDLLRGPCGRLAYRHFAGDPNAWICDMCVDEQYTSGSLPGDSKLEEYFPIAKRVH